MQPSLNIIPGVAAAVFVAVAFAFDLRHDIRRLLSGRNVVLAGICSWFLLEALKLSPEVRHYSQDEYNFGILCIVQALMGFLAGYHVSQGCPLFAPIASRVRVLDDRKWLWRLVVFCAVVGFAPVLYYSDFKIFELFSGILGGRKTWGGLIARGRYGGFREAMLQLENLVLGAGPFAVILLLDRRGTILQRITCALVAIWPLLRGYGNGTRGNLVFAIVPMLSVIYFRCKPQVQRGMLILALCATPLVYEFMAVVVASRNAGTFDLEQGAKTQYVGNEMFQELLYIVHNIPARVPYQMGETYYEELCGPVPRFIWPNKPDSLKFLLPQMRGEIDKRTGQAYYTRSLGLFGEMYLNFGFLGLFFVSFFGGWLVRGWDAIPLDHASSLPTMIFYVAGLGALYLQGRGFSLLVVYPLIFFVMAVFLISYWSKRMETES